MRARAGDRIVSIDTYRWSARPHLLHVEVRTADGRVGLGETWGVASAVEAVIHDYAAPLIDANARSAGEREAIWHELFSVANIWNYAGAEMRAISAIDLALWDLAGQAADEPVYRLLGGPVRYRIPIYNTCVDGERHRDQHRSLTEPGTLASELLESGIRAMKIWPFDQFAPVFESLIGRSQGFPGAYLPERDLQQGLAIMGAIRDAVGYEVDVMIEGHHRWDVNSAIRIGRALAPYRPAWMEDMTLSDNPQDLRRLVEETGVPILASERLMTRYAFRSLLEQRATHVVMVDLGFVGGLTEGMKIAVMASANNLPITTHDCCGPVVNFANLHLSMSAIGAMNTETVRAFYDGGWYGEVVDRPLAISDGHAQPPDVPGLGCRLRDDYRTRSDVAVRSSRLSETARNP
jgi:galactonate dehydratase